MKKATALTLSIIVAASITSFAQGNRSTPEERKAHFKEVNSTTAAGNDGAPVVLLGTIGSAVTSKEKVLAYPRLLPQSLSCEVTGFDFAISAGDKSWGPVTIKGAVFNEDIKDKIKEWDPANTKISISNIHVKCGGGDEVTARPIDLTYNH